MSTMSPGSGGAQTVGVPPKTFTMETVETVRRKYVVQAATEESAHDRLQLFFKDPSVLADGIVSRQQEEQVTNRRIQTGAKKRQRTTA